MSTRQRLAAALTSLLIAGCGVAPTPTPVDMTGVLNELTSHGATVKDILAGEAGCPDSSLHSNASRITLTLADGRDYDVYLFRWRNAGDYDTADATFQQCIAAFVAKRGSTDVDVVEVSPWRAFGPAWTDATRAAVEQSLAAAAQGQ